MSERIQRKMSKIFMSTCLEGVITGLTLVYLDYPYQTYNISICCPDNGLCTWRLDDGFIGSINTTSIDITFTKDHIGNRTLKYIVFINGKTVVLAKLLIIILPNKLYGKNTLDPLA